MISKSAHICEGAKLGKDVTVEPFAYIAADVEIGDGCWIGPGAVILDGARLGKNCKVHTAAVVAGLPQDLKFKGEYSTAVVVPAARSALQEARQTQEAAAAANRERERPRLQASSLRP